jgi:hypothetical protein
MQKIGLFVLASCFGALCAACAEEPEEPEPPTPAAPPEAIERGTGNALIVGAGLHVKRSTTSAWCTADDCYSGNCTDGLPWGATMTTSDTGSESINLVDVADGDYEIAVSQPMESPGNVQVRMFTYGSLFGEWFGESPPAGMQWRAIKVSFVGGVPSTVDLNTNETLSGDCF